MNIVLYLVTLVDNEFKRLKYQLDFEMKVRQARTPEARKAIGDALNRMGYPFTKVELPFNKLTYLLIIFR